MLYRFDDRIDGCSLPFDVVFFFFSLGMPDAHLSDRAETDPLLSMFRSVYSMGSIPTTELIDQVERAFLCSTNRKEDLQKIPLLQEFENEMKIYQVHILSLSLFNDRSTWSVFRRV